MPKQNHWRSCNKCRRLVRFDINALPACPSGGKHDHTGSFDFILEFTPDEGPAPGGGVGSMLRCNKCHTISLFSGGPTRCTQGGGHDYTGSPAYVLAETVPTGTPAGNNQWLRCKKCSTLTFFSLPMPPCPQGGGHDFTGSSAFEVNHVPVGSLRVDVSHNADLAKPGDKDRVLVLNASGESVLASYGRLAISFPHGDELPSVVVTGSSTQMVQFEAMRVNTFGSDAEVGRIALGADSSGGDALPSGAILPGGQMTLTDPPPTHGTRAGYD